MKKVLSLLLVCVMLLSFALVANAASATIAFTATDIDPDTGVFKLEVKNVSVKASVGTFAIDFDETKVALYDYDGQEVLGSKDDVGYCFEAQNSCSLVVADTDDAKSYINVEWNNTSGLRTNRVIGYVYFVALDKSGENFDANTFKLLTDDAILSDLKLKGNGGNLKVKDKDSGVTYTAESATDIATATFTYPNSDKPAGGSTPDPEPETPSYSATEEEVNAKQDWTSGEFKYPTDKVGGTDNAAVGKKVAAFGKAATALKDGNYGIKIGNRFYPGRIDVPQGSYFAIIVVNTNGDDAIEDSYTYDIYTGTDAAPTWVATGLSAVVE